MKAGGAGRAAAPHRASRRRGWRATATTCEKTTVVAPMDGVVTNLQKEEGEVVIGAQSFSPTVIMTVGDLSVDRGRGAGGRDRHPLRDPRASRRRSGWTRWRASRSRARSRRSAPRPSRAAARQASTPASTAQPGQGLQGHGHLKDPPPALRSGLNATAEITTATRRHGARRPHPGRGGARAGQGRQGDRPGRACRPRRGSRRAPAEKGEEKEGVFVVNGGQVAFRPVKTGIIGETEIEVAEGLKEGDEIVTGVLQDAAHAQGRGEDQARGQEGEEMSGSRPRRRQRGATDVAGRRPHPRRGPLAHLRHGDGGDPRPARRDLHHRPRRVPRHHGPLGLGQVDAHEPHRLPGHAQPRAPTSCAARWSRR